MELPPGFRFHPTDEELITHYLSPKVLDAGFYASAIAVVDLNKYEPWDLPWLAKMGEKEWYFFCLRDRKYPTGVRTNRATVSGYWKATGKDKNVLKNKALVGMKKTLVFYQGRAPRGQKSNWVMHEYRLDGKFNHSPPNSTKNEWVICRIFYKSAGGKKIHISSLLPSFMDSGEFRRDETSHVPCFSKSAKGDCYDSITIGNLISSGNDTFAASNRPDSETVSLNNGLNWDSRECEATEFLQESNRDMAVRGNSSGCGGPVDLHCLWNY